MFIKFGKPVIGFMVLMVLVACASYLNAEPEEKEFEFDGNTLSIIQNDIPTDLITEDRENVKVVRRLDVKNGTADTDWTLEDGTLSLKAYCYGFANCDARFEVYVPLHVEVFRNGNPTQLTGESK